MTFLLDIATHLEEQDQGYTTGREKNIFVYAMPEHITKGILLKDAIFGTQIDHELPGYFVNDFRVIVRAKEHAEGEDKAKAVADALTILNQTIGTLGVNYIRPRHLPMVFPVSEGDYLEWLVTFDASFCKTS